VRITTDLVADSKQRIPRADADNQAYLVRVFADEPNTSAAAASAACEGGAAAASLSPPSALYKRSASMGEIPCQPRCSWSAPASADWRRRDPDRRPVSRGGRRSGARRTYQVDPRVITYLERVVTAGHNACYRARGTERTPVLHYILRDFLPRCAVVQYVLLAFLLFAVPAAVATS